MSAWEIFSLIANEMTISVYSDLKIQVSYYRCCSYLDNGRALAVALHIRRKGVLCVGQLLNAFLQKPQLNICQF